MLFDATQIVPTRTSIGREINMLSTLDKVVLYISSSHKWGGGRESKKVVINRFMLLDDLFFEGLGLWVGEGGKNKGLCLGNTSPELPLNFLKFVEKKLGLSRVMFKVTVNNSPWQEADLKERWSKILQILVDNFTDVCLDARINHEYARYT